MSRFIRDEGISTCEWRAELALRTRVSMSAMGSVIDIVRRLLTSWPWSGRG